MSDDINVIEFKFNFRYKKMKSGLLMGVCSEFPFIIVKGVDIDSVSLQIQEHIINYVYIFPDKARDIIIPISKKTEVNENKVEKENPWLYHDESMPIPIKH